MMPEPDGFQVCRMLCAEPGFEFTPIVILTALDDEDSQIVAFGAGADKYITEPCLIEKFIETIKVLLFEEHEINLNEISSNQYD